MIYLELSVIVLLVTYESFLDVYLINFVEVVLSVHVSLFFFERLFLVMMICLKGMILEKDGGNMSSEYWLELELSLRMMMLGTN